MFQNPFKVSANLKQANANKKLNRNIAAAT